MRYKNTYQTVCNGVHINIKLHVRNFGLHFSNNKKKGQQCLSTVSFRKWTSCQSPYSSVNENVFGQYHPRVGDVNHDITRSFQTGSEKWWAIFSFSLTYSSAKFYLKSKFKLKYSLKTLLLGQNRQRVHFNTVHKGERGGCNSPHTPPAPFVYVFVHTFLDSYRITVEVI